MLKCCGSGICLFDPSIRDPGWVKNQDPDPESGSLMKNPDHIYRVLRNHIFGLKYLNSLRRIRDPGWNKKGSDPGWNKLGSRIRDGKNSDPG
jgi:hypothetical protein